MEGIQDDDASQGDITFKRIAKIHSAIFEKMKHYVYVYFDHRKIVKKNYLDECSFLYEPFYIGKGSKNRAFSHLAEAYLFKDERSKRGCNKEKCRLIREIKNETNKNPAVEILKYFDNAHDAYLYEESLIAKIGMKGMSAGPLLNKVAGWPPKSNSCIDHSKKIHTGKSNGMYGKKGKLSPVYGKSVYSLWVEKYGEEVAKMKEKARREKMSTAAKKYFENNEHPMSGKQHKASTKRKISQAAKKRHIISL